MATITLTVEVRLDPIPGAMHTEQSARDIVQNILDHSIGHYNPIVKISE